MRYLATPVLYQRYKWESPHILVRQLELGDSFTVI